VTQNRTIYRDTVKPEWVDYNGHLRDAFYMLIFSLSTDAFMDRIGLDDVARTSRGRSLFTLEAHINYLHEIKEGAAVRVEASVLAFDAKRDRTLRAINARHLFAPSISNIWVQRGRYLRRFALDFMEMLSPVWTATEVDRSLAANARPADPTLAIEPPR